MAEAACKENLHDIKFLDWRDSSIDGRQVSVFRIGMAGTLAYEIHGRIEDAVPVYEALLAAGQEYGIVRLGRRAYRVVHTEGGFPQINYHFPFAMRPGYPEYLRKLSESGNDVAPLVFTGSAPDDIHSRLRNPVECGWSKLIRFDHDFVGRAALEKEVANPSRQMVMLEWDHHDVADVYLSQFDKERACSSMELVEDYNPYLGSSQFHDDLVVMGDKTVGISSGRMFSPYYREMISICAIDVAHSKLGTKVEIIWG